MAESQKKTQLAMGARPRLAEEMPAGRLGFVLSFPDGNLGGRGSCRPDVAESSRLGRSLALPDNYAELLKWSSRVLCQKSQLRDREIRNGFVQSRREERHRC